MALLSQTLLTLLILFLPFSSYSKPFHHQCAHDSMNFPIKFIDVPYETDPQGRMLSTYQNIRIMFDFSTAMGLDTDLKTYLTDKVISETQNFLQFTLSVKPVSGHLKTSETSICNGTVTVPSSYQTTGVAADLVIFVTTTNEPNKNFIAYASSCLNDNLTKRPIFGRLNYNLFRIAATTNVIQIQTDIQVTLHEMTHVLGFSSGLYPLFINPTNNKPLKGHILTRIVNSNPITVLDVEPLTSRLRNYFDCSMLEGAYLENQGSSETVNSHFERRIFFNEYMTASYIPEMRVTEFSLALLEGSGWYQVDYSLAQPLTYGKNKGCDFLNRPCIGPGDLSNFEEYCLPLQAQGCSWTYRGFAYCGTTNIWNSDPNLPSKMNYWGTFKAMDDAFSDNCPRMMMYPTMDCEDSNYQVAAILPADEHYGHGGKCFMGTLFPDVSLGEASGYCFKPTCTLQSGGTFALEVAIGSQKIICSKEELVNVTGYAGNLFCPDPNKFCERISTENLCPNDCSGKGVCLGQVCKCNDGWSSDDCSAKIYKDSCSRCLGGETFKRSCYGDYCECNPSNIVCMCGLGITTGSACDNVETEVENETETETETETENGTESETETETETETENGSESGNETTKTKGDESGMAAHAEKEGNSTWTVVGLAIGVVVIMGGGAALAIKYGGRIAKSTSSVANKRLFQGVPSSTIMEAVNAQQNKAGPTMPEYKESDSSFINVSSDVAVHDLTKSNLHG